MTKTLLINNINEIEEYVGSNILKHIRYGHLDNFENHTGASLMCFNWYDIHNPQADTMQVIICFSKEHLFFICENESCINKLKSYITEEETTDRTIYNFFLDFIKEDTSFLENIEEEIAVLEDKLILASDQKCTKEIIDFRKQLLQLKKYYEQLNNIFEDLVTNESGFISSTNLRFFRILDSRIDRLYANVHDLRDYVTQVREAYQAQIDIEQNIIMKTFTVMTAIFLPLTLLVGWYGMNIKMPEFAWQYGYPFVILLAVVILVACVIFFKRKKWF